jgi:hypothetical protein
VSPQVSTLDLVTGAHAILAADGELGSLAGRAAEAAGLPAVVTVLSPPLMRQLGAELIVVRPDQVVGAVLDSTHVLDPTEFLDTTMVMLGGRPGADETWTRSR